MRISDWSSDVCSSDLPRLEPLQFREIGVRAKEETTNVPQICAALHVGCCRIAIWLLNEVIDNEAAWHALHRSPPIYIAKAGLWSVWLREIGRASCRERVCQYV